MLSGPRASRVQPRSSRPERHLLQISYRRPLMVLRPQRPQDPSYCLVSAFASAALIAKEFAVESNRRLGFERKLHLQPGVPLQTPCGETSFVSYLFCPPMTSWT